MINQSETVRVSRKYNEAAPDLGPRILVVEDDPFWQEAIGGAIKKRFRENVSIRYARSEHHADNLMFHYKFDLVIFDQTLEGNETGLELWRLRRDSYDYTPMIMFSSLRVREFDDLTQNQTHSPYFLEKKSGLKNLVSAVEVFLNPNNLTQQIKNDVKNKGKVTQLPVGRKNKFLIAAAIAIFILFGTSQHQDGMDNIKTTVKVEAIKNLSQTIKPPPSQDETLPRQTASSSSKIVSHRYVTPELQAAVDRILKRADEINQTAKNLKSQDYASN